MYQDTNLNLIEYCKYQHSIIKKYEEYIEKYIHAEIKTENVPDHLDPMGIVQFKRITIPQVTIMLKCDKGVLRQWEWLKFENPVLSPAYFIKMAYKEQMEKKNG